MESVTKTAKELMHTIRHLHLDDAEGKPSCCNGIHSFRSVKDLAYTICPQAEESMKRALVKVDLDQSCYPIEVFEEKLWRLLIETRDAQTPIAKRQEMIKQKLQSLLQSLTIVKPWTVISPVVGVWKENFGDFTLGLCRFQKWKINPETLHSIAKITKSLGKQYQVETQVNAVDQSHARHLGKQNIEDSLNVLRYAAFSIGAVERGIPRVGIGSFDQPFSHLMLCYPSEHPRQMGGHMAGGGQAVDINLASNAPCWVELVGLVSKTTECRSELEQRLLNSLKWIGDAQLSNSASVRIVAVVTALESLLILPHERKGKSRKLQQRITSFDMPIGSNVEITSEIVENIYNTRSQLVHGEVSEAHPDVEKCARMSFDQSLLGVFSEMKSSNCVTLREVIFKRCPSSLQSSIAHFCDGDGI